MGRKIGICVCCGEKKEIRGKGMCHSCYSRQYHKNHPNKPLTEAQKALQKIRNREYYRLHAEKARAVANQYNAEHREEKRERDKAYKKTEAGKASQQKSKNKRAELIKENFVEDVPIETLYEQQNGLCFYCGVECDFEDGKYETINGKLTYHNGPTHPTIDHKVPICKGGKHEPDNLVMACDKCNSAKGRKTAEEFIKFLKDKGEQNESSYNN